MEQTLEDFSAVLPEVLKNKELAEIIYNEAGSNEKDEPYALWSKIADRPTQTGVTLRKEVHNVLMKGSPGKSANSENLTSAMDGIDYLQIYIHDFGDWDGNSTLPATFTPLSINDVDVEELILYDSLGNATILDVSDEDIEPDYPIAVVGLNESLVMGNDPQTFTKSTTGSMFCTRIYVRKPGSLEPWWKGAADMMIDIKSNGCCSDIGINVKNPSGQRCRKKYGSNSFSQYLGSPGTHIIVYEFDLFGVADWVIEDAELWMNESEWWMNVTDPGKYYHCGDYVRCDYNFILQ